MYSYLPLRLFITLTSLSALAFCTPTPQRGYPQPLTLAQLQARQPLNGLPPKSNYTLKYTALGIGHQNYTCSGTAFVQSDQGDGASALLYDTTSFLESHPFYIEHLSRHCNYISCSNFPEITQNLLGDHYFSAILEPTFNLTSADSDLVLSGVKSAVAPANNTMNIPWLYLTPNANNDITDGLAAVYRIDTFRGVPPLTCDQAGQGLSVPYTAQYWFFVQ